MDTSDKMDPMDTSDKYFSYIYKKNGSDGYIG